MVVVLCFLPPIPPALPPSRRPSASPRGTAGAAAVIMSLALFCLTLAPFGWVPSRLTYALRVGEVARLQAHPIDQALISTVTATTPGSERLAPLAFFAGDLTSGSGVMPPGLDVDAATGAIVGTPTIAGTYTVSLGISDARLGRISGPAFTLRILPPA